MKNRLINISIAILLTSILFTVTACNDMPLNEADVIESNPIDTHDNIEMLADTFRMAQDEAEMPTGTFPAIHIEFELPLDRYVWGDAVVTMGGTADEFAFDGIDGKIRGRGNSSWRLEKQPFRIRFDEPRTMLDSNHAARDWTFIANHSDKSLMRNYSAYYLATLLDGMYFAPFARFVDVYFNGEYQGVYMLCIQVQVNEGRAELTYDPDPTISEFLIEMDSRVPYDDDSEEGVTFVTVHYRHYDILFPRGDELTSAHVEYIRDYLTRIGELIYAQDPTVFEYVHLPSIIDFYIVQELYKNVDVAYSSVFMQIRGQGEERRLEMGPVWDFDVSAGNAYFQGRNREGREYYSYYYGPHGLWAAWTNRWFRSLILMPEFLDATADRWNEIRDEEIRRTLARIRFMATHYQLAFERNFERWPILGEYVWPNPDRVVEIDTFMGQVDYLLEFLEIRAEAFGDYLNRERSS
jgi:hypothetical protein